MPSPRQSRRTISMPSNVRCLRSAYASGARAKSFGFQPMAKDTSTRPSERLSTTAHSSATRMGWCRGMTTLPARILMRSVVSASTTPASAGLGKIPPKA